ncbi:formyltransferase family protein [Fuchsiella alkaliacetigena]|uniref:formyltransferase family protein n=1 Tax=Fuchsiella alkaliacetigena TaxID=957042 RepID=UPI00200AB445|nr:formyltransferase family protein [Fuchsiella alkaliacetigena]MCK8824336.1 hypothetical protein [Fuchsiella alkaliacetigena]
MKKMKLLCMTRDNKQQLEVFNKIYSMKDYIEFSGLVIENKSLNDRIKRLIRGRSIFQITNILAFKVLSRFLINKTNRNYDNSFLADDFPIINVDNINDSKVLKFIKSINPDLIIIKGVSLINETLLNSIDADIINIHGGLLPYYRGLQVGIWPIIKGEYNKVGITYHKVNKGVDTGDIILKKRISEEKIRKIIPRKIYDFKFYKEINFLKHKLVVNSIGEFLDRYFKIKSKNETDLMINNSNEYNLYSHIALSDYINFWISKDD